MTNHIGRLQAIGIAKEAVSGTPVAAAAWLPKVSGDFKPSFEKAVDDSAYGVIDEVYDSQTVKNVTEVNINGIVRDDWIGYLLLGALGKVTRVAAINLAGTAGGTPARGDYVYVGAVGAETWKGYIKKILTIGTATYYWVSTTAGTLSDTNTVTNGVWTATATISTYAAAKGHFFERLNTNAHPSFSIYGSDEVGDEYTSYALVNNFDMEVAVGDFAKFNASFRGKKLTTTTGLAPAYTEDTPFLAKHAAVYFGTNEAALNAATASSVQRFKMSINKNLADVQAFGDTDIASIHNQQFGVSGDLEAIYNAVTFRNLVANSTKQACRLKFVNSEVAALYSATTQSIYRSIYVDMARLSFEEWTRSSDNNNLVTQTLGFSSEYKAADLMSVEVLLINAQTTAYDA